MTPPAAFSTTVLKQDQPNVECRFADTVFYRFPARLLCAKPTGIITSLDFGALLSTGDFYSVVFNFSNKQGIQIICEDVPVSFTPTWFGIPCRVVRVYLGLKIEESQHPRPFRLLALLPLDLKAVPDDMPPLLRLGAEFLHRNRAEVVLPSGTEDGRLVIPF